jgi:hypothetical protein
VNPPPGVLLTHPATSSSAADEPTEFVGNAPEIAGGAVVMRFYISTSGGTVIAVGDQPESVDVAHWPAPSARPITSGSASALERATSTDPAPRLPEIEIDDDLGL